MPRHPLFQAALDADEAFTRTIAELFPGKDRWSITRAERLHPAIVAAYTSKVEADTAWIVCFRNERTIAMWGSIEFKWATTLDSIP